MEAVGGTGVWRLGGRACVLESRERKPSRGCSAAAHRGWKMIVKNFFTVTLADALFRNALKALDSFGLG